VPGIIQELRRRGYNKDCWVKIILDEGEIMEGTSRVNVKASLRVLIVLKKDQHSGKLTEGVVKDILTKSPTHPHGIKVRLESGEIGRVQKIL
jgi:uncharacterized repeat protein (TIGR03833 family)